ncbi:MAG TPA: hypothetical protein VK162_07115 [Streptosporangiaceae bacterium]|nr:hypothetical protein [Streptosporangiaceae bacterium]
MLAGQLLFQGGAGGLVDAPGKAQVAGFLARELQVITRRTQGFLVIALISASTLPRGSSSWPPSIRPAAPTARRY